MMQKLALAPGSGPLPNAVPGQLRHMTRSAGRIGYYVAGDGPPLLLIHSINAAASAYEMRPIFERMQASRRVYAMDLPGFGQSDRSERRYDARLYTAGIQDMAEEIAAERAEPVDAVALSLSCEHLARAAVERPERFRCLTLMTPTGFERTPRASTEQGASLDRPWLRRALDFPLWKRRFFDALTSRPSMRLFLAQTWGSWKVDQGLLEYQRLTTSQPGAEHAAYDFISGAAWSADALTVYERLTMPVWAPYGKRAGMHSFDKIDRALAWPNWLAQAYDSGAFLHFQNSGRFFPAFDRFLADPATFVREG